MSLPEAARAMKTMPRSGATEAHMSDAMRSPGRTGFQTGFFAVTSRTCTVLSDLRAIRWTPATAKSRCEATAGAPAASRVAGMGLDIHLFWRRRRCLTWPVRVVAKRSRCEPATTASAGECAERRPTRFSVDHLPARQARCTTCRFSSTYATSIWARPVETAAGADSKKPPRSRVDLIFPSWDRRTCSSWLRGPR